MKIIVGLGNPGKRYEKTPHNIGFDVVDYLADSVAEKWKKSLRFRARTIKTVLAGEEVVLVKPETFMNNSGMAVSAILRFYKAVPADLIIILDDVALDFGRLRIRDKGRSGGHNGLASVIDHVTNDLFVRVRVGVGQQREGENLVKHVLSPFSKKDKEEILNIVTRAGEAVCGIVEFGVIEAMNRYNGLLPENH
ncbi:MAG: aminoacyl-tRNA hydrolase [Kiritimatiellae bacterium]|nr:aminoacyl-tRNA hydrolase [Kiritimatiellia bacterium]